MHEVRPSTGARKSTPRPIFRQGLGHRKNCQFPNETDCIGSENPTLKDIFMGANVARAARFPFFARRMEIPLPVRALLERWATGGTHS